MNECNYPTDICKRFWSKVVIPKDHVNQCWIWSHGATDKDGYGIFHVETRWAMKAHRFAYQYYKGPIKNDYVMHSCDNPACCNPNHLVEGNADYNNYDRSTKGRSAIGSRGGNAKLTEKIVREIKIAMRDHYYSNPMIAKEFGISQSNASRIRNGQIWSHVHV